MRFLFVLILFIVPALAIAQKGSTPTEKWRLKSAHHKKIDKSWASYIDYQDKSYSTSDDTVFAYAGVSDSTLIVRVLNKRKFEKEIHIPINRNARIQLTKSYSINCDYANGLFTILSRSDMSSFLTVISLIDHRIVTAKEVPKKYGFTNAFVFSDSSVCLAAFYAYHPGDVSNPVSLALFSLDQNTITKYVYLPSSGVECSYLPSNFIDAIDGVIAVASPIDYKVLLYNQELSCIDTITSEFPDDNPKYNRPQNSTPKQIISEVKEMDKLRYRIDNIYFLDSSTILLSIRPPSDPYSEQRLIEIWTRTNGEWVKKNVQFKANPLPFVFFSKKRIQPYSSSFKLSYSDGWEVYARPAFPKVFLIGFKPFYQLRAIPNFMREQPKMEFVFRKIKEWDEF